jgi:hypothetical protein
MHPVLGSALLKEGTQLLEGKTTWIWSNASDQAALKEPNLTGFSGSCILAVDRGDLILV